MFPAQAGMNRIFKGYRFLSSYVPRTGGDEPPPFQSVSPPYLCSPHRRG